MQLTMAQIFDASTIHNAHCAPFSVVHNETRAFAKTPVEKNGPSSQGNAMFSRWDIYVPEMNRHR
jgi:hypothetical protein